MTYTDGAFVSGALKESQLDDVYICGVRQLDKDTDHASCDTGRDPFAGDSPPARHFVKSVFSPTGGGRSAS